MKKTHLFLLTVLMFGIFACTPPSDIQIKGSISDIKFEANMDFGQEFKNMVIDSFSGDGNDGLVTQYCVNKETQTYLIKMDAIDEEFTITSEGSGAGTIIINGEEVSASSELGGYKLGEAATVFKSGDNDNTPITLSLSSFGDSLKGFSFNANAIEAKIYITSHYDIIKAASIKLTFVNLDTSEKTSIAPFIVSNLSKSNIDLSLTEYNGNGLPANGHPITIFGELVNAKSDFQLDIEVVLPNGTVISNDLFDTPIDISAELVIWLPMDLKADENGAEISFGEIFDGVGSFINDISEYMESLSLVVGMEPVNPFKDGKLVMKQEGTSLRIENDLYEKTLNFIIKEKDMETIGEMKKDFNPDIAIVYKKGDTLKIPKDFGTAYVSLSAKINFKIGM